MFPPVLVLAAVAVGTVPGAAVLASAHWPYRSPAAAILLWQALGLSWGLAAVGALAGLGAVRGRYGVAGGALSGASQALHDTRLGFNALSAAARLAVLTASAALLAMLCWVLVAATAAVIVARRRHRALLSLLAHGDPKVPGALVVDHPAAAAYCVPGLRSQIVISAGTLDLLDQAELAAVLAHERAHQAGRHHLLVALAALPATAFPLVPAFAYGRDEVARLAELAADDAAAARSPRLAVAEALLALGSAPAVAWALGAGGSTAAARVRRLIAAPNPLSRTASTAGGLTVAALSTLPLILLAAPACCLFGVW